MASYSYKKNAQGNYEIFQDGQRISTGSVSSLARYGLSETSSTPAPMPGSLAAIQASSSAPSIAYGAVNTTPQFGVRPVGFDNYTFFDETGRGRVTGSKESVENFARNYSVPSPIVPTTITRSGTTSTPSPVIPPAKTDDINSAGIIAGATSYTTPVVDPNVKPTTQSTPYGDQAKSLYERITGLIGENKDKTAYEQEQLQTSGALELEKKQKQLSARLTAINLEDQAIPLKLEQGATGKGIITEILSRQTTEARRQNAISALSIQSEYAINQGDLETARLTAQRAVDLKYKDIETQIDQYTKQLQIITPFLTAEEKKIAEQRQTENENKKAELATKKNQQTALVNDANQAKDSVSASKALALDPSDPQFNVKLAEIQRTVKIKDENVWGNPYTLGGDLVQRNSVTGEIRTAVNVSKGTSTTPANILAGLKPEQQKDPFFQLLANSVGGKPLTDTSIQSLTKGINVLGQLGVLQTNVKDTNTGPILGLFRGANPWDTNAQTIKAQLNAIVPNLARGIYGEVGVLTDNDIKTYAKTLPNLTSTEDVRNAVLGVTLDLIGKSIKNTLQVNAAAGRDVSGFVDLYTEMQSTRESIFSQIPGYKGASTPSLSSLGITPDEQNLFQSVVGVSSSTSQTTSGGFFSNIWKALTGN